MSGNTLELATKAKLIVSGMAFFPCDDGVLVINMHNKHYRAKFNNEYVLICTNMSDKSIAKIKEIISKNKEFIGG